MVKLLPETFPDSLEKFSEFLHGVLYESSSFCFTYDVHKGEDVLPKIVPVVFDHRAIRDHQNLRKRV